MLIREMINNVDLIVKYVSFIKTLLLIIVSGVVTDNWNAINKSMLVGKKRDKWIGTNNLNPEKKKKGKT